MRVTLRKKAFAFFLLFEVCMLAIFGMLLHMLDQAEQESLRQERAKRIIGETEQLALTFVKAGDGVVNYCRTHDTDALKPFDEAADELPKKCDWLNEQFQDSPRQLEVFKRVDKNARDLLKVMRKVRNHVETMTTLEAAALMDRARVLVQPKLNEMVKDATRLVEMQKEIVNESPDRERKQRELYRQYIKTGFIAATLLTIFGLMVFFRDVIGRLSVMEDNSRRLARNKPLQPPLPGSDEIAHLDGVFHDMAGALKEAQEVRKAFVAMVSHDLRSPLTSIGGFLELLEMGVMGPLSADASHGVERARVNVERLIRLINDLLDLEKMESGTIKLNMAQTSIKQVLDQSIEAVDTMAQNHKVSLVRAYEDMEIFADQDRLVQVVVNLLGNAIKFSPEGAAVSVRLSSTAEQIEVRVVDQGRGVPDKYRELIFERFKQVSDTDHTQKGGTGLGLPICKAIIEQHGGSIGVDSTDQVGSQFWFKVPRQAPVSQTVSQTVSEPLVELVDTVR